MPKIRTLQELELATRAAEERAKKIREELKRRTTAEEAKINAEIIKAVKQWQDSLPYDKQTAWVDLPEMFREAGKNGQVMSTYQPIDLYDDYNDV